MNSLSRAIVSIRLRLNRRRLDSGDYLAAYAENTNLKARIDPQMAIGGMWKTMGRHQFEFLKKNGLEPYHKLLDIGCGSLRGGLLFIDYLEEGNYTGFDLLFQVIEGGREQVRVQRFAEKKPTLLVNRQKSLTFDFLDGSRSDFLISKMLRAGGAST